MSGVLEKKLFALAENEYRIFQAKLTPTVSIDNIIGVRIPVLRNLAKELGDEEIKLFLDELPHKYYDENNLHGILISRMKNFDNAVSELDRFLPFVDNWATCDIITPKVFGKHKEELVPHIRRWLKSKDIYTVRFGIEMLMAFYLDGDFKPVYLEWVSKIKSDEYYIKMMVAWYFATALTKQYDAALPYIENKVLPDWTHNKTIQKAIESFRIEKEQKEYLRGLKVKNNA